MKEHRQCPYCKGSYDDDVTSDKAPILGRKCAHAICVGCLEHLRKEEKRITKRKVVATIKCPECKVSGSFVVSDKPNLAFCQILKDLAVAEEETKMRPSPPKRANTDDSGEPEIITVDEEGTTAAAATTAKSTAAEAEAKATAAKVKATATTIRHSDPEIIAVDDDEEEASAPPPITRALRTVDNSDPEIIAVDEEEAGGGTRAEAEAEAAAAAATTTTTTTTTVGNLEPEIMAVDEEEEAPATDTATASAVRMEYITHISTNFQPNQTMISGVCNQYTLVALAFSKAALQMSTNKDHYWMMQAHQLAMYKLMKGHCRVPMSNVELGNWVMKQRASYKINKLETWKVDVLESIGFEWRSRQIKNPRLKRNAVTMVTNKSGRLKPKPNVTNKIRKRQSDLVSERETKEPTTATVTKTDEPNPEILAVDGEEEEEEEEKAAVATTIVTTVRTDDSDPEIVVVDEEEEGTAVTTTEGLKNQKQQQDEEDTASIGFKWRLLQIKNPWLKRNAVTMVTSKSGRLKPNPNVTNKMKKRQSDVASERETQEPTTATLTKTDNSNPEILAVDKEEEAGAATATTVRTDDSDPEIIVVNEEEEGALATATETKVTNSDPEILAVDEEEASASAPRGAIRTDDSGPEILADGEEEEAKAPLPVRTDHSDPEILVFDEDEDEDEAAAAAALKDKERKQQEGDVGSTAGESATEPGVEPAETGPEAEPRGQVQQEMKKNHQLQEQRTPGVPQVATFVKESMPMGQLPTTFQPSMPSGPSTPMNSLMYQNQMMGLMMYQNQFTMPMGFFPTILPSNPATVATATSDLQTSIEDMKWKVMIYQLKEFKARAGHCMVPSSFRELGSWVAEQRFLFKTNQLPTTRIYELNSLGFQWDG